MFGLVSKKELQKYLDLHDNDIKIIEQLTTRNHELQAIIEHLQTELEYQKAKLENIKQELGNERLTSKATTGERSSGKDNANTKRAKRNL